MRRLVISIVVVSLLGFISGAFADIYHFHESFDSDAWKTKPEYKGTVYTGSGNTYMVENYSADDGDGDLGELLYYAHQNLVYDYVWHYYEFSEEGYLLSNPVIKLNGNANTGYTYGIIKLAVWDGSAWNEVASTGNGDQTLTLDLQGDPTYQNLDVLKVRIGACVWYVHSWADATHDWLDVVADMTPIPEPTIGILMIAGITLSRFARRRW